MLLAGSTSRTLTRWWWRTGWIRRAWRVRLAAITLGVAAAFGLGEIALRMPSCPMPRDLRTALFQCYVSEYEDENISFEHPKLFLNIPKPHVDTGCSWNGYVWHHHGDHFGYRNPTSPPRADVVLLGDSMTYGHGV